MVRALMHGRLHLRPWEIARLTPGEVALALDEDTEKPRPPTGGQALDPQQGPAEYAARWRAMTPAQRLARAKEGA